ncbi:MAG: sugar transferase [Prevotella sp.]|nr:sugar transferase [Prevotella sp.]MBR1557147.1 sugar transferase [Prevotella sp.]
MTIHKSGYIIDGMNGFERNVKRVFDLLVSIICLIIFSPLFLFCYIIIKREKNGPVIYEQERIGRFGRPFHIYKFRSMVVDAEEKGPKLCDTDDDDPRLTKAGKFLRAHHLDELPQFWNVFKGEMSFVGPRPERKFFIDQIMERDNRYQYLFQIRPGITSMATLYNGYTDTMEKMLKRLEMDLEYLEHRSWALDFKILGLTFTKIVFGKKF